MVYPPAYQNRIPMWIGGITMESAVMAGARGYNLMRNVGDTEAQAKAISAYVAAGRDNGHNLTGANVMIERFMACSESSDEAAERLGEFFATAERYTQQLIRQMQLGEKLPISGTEAELASATSGRIAIGGPEVDPKTLFITGTPKTLTDKLEELMVGTGCNRILVAVDDADRKSMELIASQVLPRLRKLHVQIQGT